MKLHKDTVNGLELIVVKQVKVTKRGMAFDYLNLFVKIPQHLSAEASGLIGEWSSVKYMCSNLRLLRIVIPTECEKCHGWYCKHFQLKSDVLLSKNTQ